MKLPIVFLGPAGATFSHDAYAKLAELFAAPTLGDAGVEIFPVSKNGDVVPTILERGGYGAIAMETKAEGRVAEPVESFIELLTTCPGQCPLVVSGALQLQLHFALMTRPDLGRESVVGVIAHPKALGVCRGNLKKAAWPTEESASNGQAAQAVASNDQYAKFAALGPKSAATKYGLQIIESAFEDETAVTTFFLLAPVSAPVTIGQSNRALVVFRLPSHPGALVDALEPFKDYGINMIQIHSVHTGNGQYDFGIQLECAQTQLENFRQAIKLFSAIVGRSIIFGPFQVVCNVFEGND